MQINTVYNIVFEKETEAFIRINTVGWLVVLSLTALWDSILVYIGPSPKEREKEEKKDRMMRVKMSKQPTPTASAEGPCPTVIQIVGRPKTGS